MANTMFFFFAGAVCFPVLLALAPSIFELMMGPSPDNGEPLLAELLEGKRR